jgi:hypothetical protein
MTTYAPELAPESTEIDSESLADRILADAARAEGITAAQLLDKMAERANANPRFHCLQPHDLERLSDLPEERCEHISKCSFCQVLLEGARPSEAQAVAYGMRAVAAIRRPRTAISKLFGLIARCLIGLIRLLTLPLVLLSGRFFRTELRADSSPEAIDSEVQIAQQRTDAAAQPQ